MSTQQAFKPLAPSLPSAFDAAGSAASLSLESIWLLTAVVAAVFVLIAALTFHALRRPRPVREKLWVMGGGLAFPAVVLSLLFAYSAARSVALLKPAPDDALLVTVVAHGWWWEVRYRGPDGRDVVSANEVRLPVGRPVRLALTASDVIHSFWVPQLAGKVDMVPGRINHLALVAQRAGIYRGQCAEFCGVQHARMALQVVVLETQAFDAWLAAEARDAVAPTTERARAGAALFLQSGCAACHTVRGVSVGATVAPDLTHVAARGTLGAGTLANEPGAMLAWIAGVQTLKPGAAMPSFSHLPPETLAALTAYLEGLR